MVFQGGLVGKGWRKGETETGSRDKERQYSEMAFVCSSDSQNYSHAACTLQIPKQIDEKSNQDVEGNQKEMKTLTNDPICITNE